MNKIYQKSFSGNKNAGFTLIELLVVVLIIGILSAVALPKYQMAVYKTRFAKVRPLVHQLVNAQEVYYMTNGQYAREPSELDVGIPASCSFAKHDDWEYDVLSCPDAQYRLHKAYGGISALVTKCPKATYPGGHCAVYRVPYKVHHPLMGRGPHCAADGGEASVSFARKLCLSLGGKKETDSWAERYYL